MSGLLDRHLETKLSVVARGIVMKFRAGGGVANLGLEMDASIGRGEGVLRHVDLVCCWEVRDHGLALGGLLIIAELPRLDLLIRRRGDEGGMVWRCLVVGLDSSRARVMSEDLLRGR